MKDFLEIPLFLQLMLAVGFICYSIAFIDYRKNEKIVDVIMISLIFGLPVGGVYLLSLSWICSLIAATGSLVVSVVWAKKGRVQFYNWLKSNDIAYENNEGNVWQTLATRKGLATTQITVALKDGKRLYCENVSNYNECEFSPYLIDDDGIAFYVDKIKSPGDKQWETLDNVIYDEHWGAEITYVPKTDIKYIQIRHAKKK